MMQQNQYWGFPEQHGQYYPSTVQPRHQWFRQIVIEDAIGIARQQVAGEVVKAELEREQGRLYYEVDILATNGRKYEVKIDANNGAVLGVELD